MAGKFHAGRQVTVAAAAALLLAGCSQPGSGAASPGGSTSASPSPTTSASAGRSTSTSSAYYDHAGDNDAAAAAKCDALGVGADIFALVGKTTLASQLPATAAGVSCTFFLAGDDPSDKTFAKRDSISVTLHPSSKAEVERNVALITAPPPVTRLDLGEDAWWWSGSTVPSISNGQCEVLSEGQALGIYYVSLKGKQLLNAENCRTIAGRILGL